MSIIGKLKPHQAIGLAIVFAVFAATLSGVCQAETLQMLPAHTPYRADAGVNPGWFGLVCAIGAILFLW